jgi:hypothetical protein
VLDPLIQTASWFSSRQDLRRVYRSSYRCRCELDRCNKWEATMVAEPSCLCAQKRNFEKSSTTVAKAASRATGSAGGSWIPRSRYETVRAIRVTESRVSATEANRQVNSEGKCARRSRVTGSRGRPCMGALALADGRRIRSRGQVSPAYRLDHPRKMFRPCDRRGCPSSISA